MVDEQGSLSNILQRPLILAGELDDRSTPKEQSVPKSLRQRYRQGMATLERRRTNIPLRRRGKPVTGDALRLRDRGGSSETRVVSVLAQPEGGIPVGP